MTPEGERLATAVRTAAAIQTATRHMQRALQVLSEAEIETRQELDEAREAVYQSEAKKRETVTA